MSAAPGRPQASSRPLGGQRGHAVPSVGAHMTAAPGHGLSLKRQLLLWLLVPQLVLWLAGAFFTYNLTARYANQAIDAALSTASRALARQVKPVGSGLLVEEFGHSGETQRVTLVFGTKDRLYAVITPSREVCLRVADLLPSN